MPMIANVLASIAVHDLGNAMTGYQKLLGRGPDATPMPGVSEWSFSRGGWLQVYRATDTRVGNGSCTFAVDDIDEMVRHAEMLGIDVSDRSDGPRVRTLMITDPDGNHLAFAQTSDPTLAK